MSTFAIALVATALASAPDGLADALDAARAPSIAAVEIARVDGAVPSTCAPSADNAAGYSWDAPKIARSGKLRVRGHGAGCDFWLSVDVRAKIDVAILTRDVAKGEALDDALDVKRVTQGARLSTAASPRNASSDARGSPPAMNGFVPPAGARASRVIKAGAIVNASDIGPAVAPGTKVAVTLVRGELRIEDAGTIVACSRSAGATCARTRGGALVTGTMQSGALVVEVQ